MHGREPKIQNDIFFVCSFIEFLGRKTLNHRAEVVNALGKANIQHLLELADVYHSENMDKLADDFVLKASIPTATFDNISMAHYSIPTIWDMGKVHKRLIVSLMEYRQCVDAGSLILEVYNSWISTKLENYNSSLYFENPDYIFQSYLNGALLE